jgi:hypothetical protein
MAMNPGFFQDQAVHALTSSYVSYPMKCFAGYLAIFNDDTSGSNEIRWSWDGVADHGSLLPKQYVEIQDSKVASIWLKYVTGAPAYKVIALAA